MQKTVGFIEGIALAMTGKRSPWGKPSGNGGGSSGGSGGDGGDGGDGEDGNSSSDTPSSEGSGQGSDGGDKPSGPRNPWASGSGSDGNGGNGNANGPRRSASIEDIFKNRGPEGPRRGGGSGGGGGVNFQMPTLPGGKSWLPIIAIGLAAVWLFVSSVHFVQPREQGVVTYLGGQYSHTLEPGTNFTAPWPVQVVTVDDVRAIRLERIPEGANEEKLILTADQNLVDLSYLIRWNISNLPLFRFQLADPEDTMAEVAEAAMRAAVAEQDLDTVLTGAGREEIELNVRTNMQAVLDAFQSGIAIQGIEIEKTDAPQQVIEAFNDVLAARQDAERRINEARRYEQQLLAQAQGDVAAFDNIYAEYRLAPEVTRQRLYYETMERVLANTDKTIIETDGITAYLPLPEISRRAAQSSAAAQAATPTTPAGGQ